MSHSTQTETQLKRHFSRQPLGQVVVIGGGIAGLAASARLAMLGVQVKLIEARPSVGGMLLANAQQNSEAIEEAHPHLVLGHCTHLTDLYRHLGIADQIDWHHQLCFCLGGEQYDILQGDDLPAPMHLSRSIMSFTFLTMREKLMLAKAMLQLVRLGRPGSVKESGKTFFQWLTQHHQSLALIKKFWEPIIRTTLYASIDRVDARYGIQVFQEGFLAHGNGLRVGVPKVSGQVIYDSINKLIQASGGEILLNQKAASVTMCGGKINAVVLENGESIRGEHFISALAPGQLEAISDGQMMRIDTRLRRLDRLRFNGVLQFHFWFEPPVGGPCPLPARHMLWSGAPMQWVYDNGYDIEQGGQHLWGLSYEADQWMGHTDEQLVGMALAQIQKMVPSLGESKLIDVKVVRGEDATLVPLPGIDGLRPRPTGRISNLYLAGAWCQTGWACNLEGAVRSGYQAVNALGLAHWGLPRVVVVEDLPSESIYRFLAEREDKDASA